MPLITEHPEDAIDLRHKAFYEKWTEADWDRRAKVVADSLGKDTAFDELIDRLLYYGGEFVTRNTEVVSASELLGRGEYFVGGRKNSDVELIEGLKKHCFYNTFEMVSESSETYGAYWGYALRGKDWVDHAWLRNKTTGKLVETTVWRAAYFGALLDSDQLYDLEQLDKYGEAMFG